MPVELSPRLEAVYPPDSPTAARWSNTELLCARLEPGSSEAAHPHAGSLGCPCTQENTHTFMMTAVNMDETKADDFSNTYTVKCVCNK